MVSSIASQRIVNTLVPINANNTAEGTGLAVDVDGFSEVLMIANVGVSGDTLSGSVYWTISFQECAVTTAGSFTQVAAAAIEGGSPVWVINDPAEDQTLVVRRYKGKLKYVRILFTQTGTHTVGTPLSATIVMSGATHIPVTQETELGAAT